MLHFQHNLYKTVSLNYKQDNMLQQLGGGEQSKADKNDLDQYIKKINDHINIQDLYHILYLKPFECVLDLYTGGLPTGLKIVKRKLENKFELQSIQRLLSFKQFQQLSLQQKQRLEQAQGKLYENYLQYLNLNNGDNLLCQMKTHGAIQIAICICMYNQNREMLKSTLLGVGENIINLCKQGVDPDKVIVIVIQDGIQKMDQSILQLFKVLENQSGMRFNSNKRKNIKDLFDKMQLIEGIKSRYGWEGEDKYIDMNSFIFSEQEQKQRRKIRFLNVKAEYDEIRKLFKQIQDLSNRRNVTHDDLPAKALQYFKMECRHEMLKTKKQDSQQNLNKYFIQVSQNLSKSKPFIQNALTKTSQYCKQYINSRSQMSHVSFFRSSMFFPNESGLSLDQIEDLQELKIKIHSTKDQQDRVSLIQKNELTLEQIRQKMAIKMNIFFVVKYKNSQKLSSHNWFFNGFCKQFGDCQVLKLGGQNKLREGNMGKSKSKLNNISPNYSILLDVGLRPQSHALCKMYNAMRNNPKIGGVCGYMGLKIQKTEDESQQQLRQSIDFVSNMCLYVVDIQRAQQVQYHFAHLIDKSFQSIFKFIHVLPGAFSGYSMRAIWGSQKVGQNNDSDQLLEKYFKSIKQKLKGQTYKQSRLTLWTILARVLLPDFISRTFISPVQKESYQQLMYESNVYLAQDRILCMGIHKNNYDLMFLPDAYSFVDPVKDIPSLMGQRKRWINGSYFAFEKVSDQFKEIACCQTLTIQIWYLTFMNMLAFIAPGFYMFSISVAMEAVKADILAKLFSDSLNQDSQFYNAFVFTINLIYALLIFGLIYYSVNLTNRNDKFVKYIYAVSTILGLMSIIMLVILVVDLVRGLSSSSSYLISNQSPTFISQIPGGQQTVDIIRYIVLGIMGLYGVPLLFYSLMFRNITIMIQVIFGSISFAFYSPTYLIILNIYALCRMDDLSWGTKGLDTGAGDQDAAVMNNWKVIKMVHVGKLVFWNVIVAGLLIHFGSDYLVRFWLTFALMVLIASTMLLKVSLAILYYVYYMICVNTKSQQLTTQEKDAILVKPSLFEYFRTSDGDKSKLETLLRQEIKKNIIECVDLKKINSQEDFECMNEEKLFCLGQLVDSLLPDNYNFLQKVQIYQQNNIRQSKIKFEKLISNNDTYLVNINGFKKTQSFEATNQQLGHLKKKKSSFAQNNPDNQLSKNYQNPMRLSSAIQKEQQPYDQSGSQNKPEIMPPKNIDDSSQRVLLEQSKNQLTNLPKQGRTPNSDRLPEVRKGQVKQQKQGQNLFSSLLNKIGLGNNDKQKQKISKNKQHQKQPKMMVVEDFENQNCDLPIKRQY